MPILPRDIAPLPSAETVNTVPVLAALVDARGALGELRGTAKSLPNQAILLDTLFLQEALASSEIENIVTTQDEAFSADLLDGRGSPEAKEVACYRQAMRHGYDKWRKNGFIGENMLIEMFRVLKQRDDGYRTTPGTVLRNERTGETIYEPPQDHREIVRLMRELEAFINDAEGPFDPLVNMALIHHRFESIHPFPDGNGRVGRMLNVLYLTHAGLLDAPILYLSRAVNATKPDYYRLLQAVRERGAWEEWVIYMLKAVTETAHSTLHLVEGIRDLIQTTKNRLRDELPKIYSQDLLNNLFRHPYTRVEYLERDIPHGRQTARKYLKQLAKAGFVREVREGRNNYYVNRPLIDLLLAVPAEDERRAAATGG